MKRLVLQVKVKMPPESVVGNRTFKYNDDLYDLSEFQAREYARLTDSDYMQITDCSFMPNHHPIWQRLKVFELTEYDQILYLDSDVVVLPNAPNIFKLYKDYEFSAVPSQEYHKNTKTIQERLKQEQKRYKSSSTYHAFCSAVMLMRKDWLAKTKDIYQKYISKFERVSHDQGVLNCCIIEQGEKYNHLSYHWGQWDKSGDYFIHLGFWRKNNFNLNKFCKKYNINFER